MKIRVSDLLKNSRYFRTSKVMAGEKGLSNMVTFVQVMECMDTLKFLRGGELLLHSLYAFKDNEEEQVEVIERLSELGVAGLCVPENYLLEHKYLPKKLKETADQLGFPIISFPEGYMFGEICEYVNNNFYSPLTGEILRENEVIEEMYNDTYREGLTGVAKALYKWTGLSASIVYEGEILSFPAPVMEPTILQNRKKWHRLKKGGNLFNNVDQYQYKTRERTYEWLGAKILTPSTHANYVFLFKGDQDFTNEEQLLLSASLSACAMEIKRLRNLNEIKRIYRKDLLDNILNQTLNLDTARHQISLLGYELLSKGRAAFIQINTKGDSTKSEQFLSNLDDILRESLLLSPFWVQINDNTVVILVLDADNQPIQRLHQNLSSRYQGTDFIIGLGNQKQYPEFKISYSEAEQALKIGNCLDAQSGVFDIRELGFLGFVNLPANRDNIFSYYSRYIRPLEDRFKGDFFEEIMSTLKSFIECRYHFLKTAETMHLHRNTVTYRIDIIEKTCDISFQNQEDCFNMTIAIKLLPLMRTLNPPNSDRTME